MDQVKMFFRISPHPKFWPNLGQKSDETSVEYLAGETPDKDL